MEFGQRIGMLWTHQKDPLTRLWTLKVSTPPCGRTRCLRLATFDGQAVWKRIIRAIEELQDSAPAGNGQPVH